MALPCTKEPIEGVDYYKSKVTLSRKEREDEKNSIIRKVLEQIDVKPTPIESVAKLRETYPEGDLAPAEGYDGLFLIETGTDEGYLYFFDNGTKKWTRSIIYEDSPAVEELKAGKVNKDMIDWGTMPETITDKNTFYKEVSKVFATADHSIYMFGTPEELQRVWDIWGKPEGYKATHTYIAIRPISNKSSRHAFIMWVFSSNYANPYFRVISGYAGTYVSANDKGWVNINSLATPPTMDAADLLAMIDNSHPGIIVDLAEDGKRVELHLDNTIPQEYTLTVARPSQGNQVYTLDGAEVARLKGLRAWVRFSYNGNMLCMSKDIYFPKFNSGIQYFVSAPIPNPQIFSEQIIVQYDNVTNELALKSTGGSISADMKILGVIGIL